MERSNRKLLCHWMIWFDFTLNHISPHSPQFEYRSTLYSSFHQTKMVEIFLRIFSILNLRINFRQIISDDRFSLNHLSRWFEPSVWERIPYTFVVFHGSKSSKCDEDREPLGKEKAPFLSHIWKFKLSSVNFGFLLINNYTRRERFAKILLRSRYTERKQALSKSTCSLQQKNNNIKIVI